MASIIGLESLLPVGYRFHPTDVEIVNHFLKLKMLGMDSQVQIIKEVDVCKWEPWDLPRLSGVKSNDPEWYFFCPRDFKYANGRRTNRATNTGYWKVTGKDRKIKIPGTNEPIGIKKTLVFYEGRVSSSVRTTWVMHEYHPTDIPRIRNQRSFVICRLKKKPDEQNQDSVFRNFVADETMPEVDTQLEDLEFTTEAPFQSLNCMFPSALQPQPRVQEENESFFFANCINGDQFQIGTDEHDEDFTRFWDLDYEKTNCQMNFAAETAPSVIDTLSDTQMGSWRRDCIDEDTKLGQAWFGHDQEAPNLLNQHASSNQYQQMRMVRTQFGNPTSSIHEHREEKKVLRDEILEMDASSVSSEADRPFEINCLELVPQEFPVKVTTCKPKYEQKSNNMSIRGVAPSSIDSNERLSGIARTKEKGRGAAKHGTVVDLSAKTTLLRRQSNPPSVYFVNAIVGVVLFIVVLRVLEFWMDRQYELDPSNICCTFDGSPIWEQGNWS